MISYVLNTSDPTLRAVFAEDAAALIGILIAVTGIGLHQLTGSPVPDAIGSILIGLLLAVVAVFLIDRNRRFLVGESGPARDPLDGPRARCSSRPDIDRITYLHLEFVGPGRLYLVAAVDMAGDDVEHSLAVRLRRVERDLEQHENIEEAVLTLATPEEESLTPVTGARSSGRDRRRLPRSSAAADGDVVDAMDDVAHRPALRRGVATAARPGRSASSSRCRPGSSGRPAPGPRRRSSR